MYNHFEYLFFIIVSGKRYMRKSDEKMKKNNFTLIEVVINMQLKLVPDLLSYGILELYTKERNQRKHVNKKTLELFNDYFGKHGKSKIVSEIEKLAEEIKNSRSKK